MKVLLDECLPRKFRTPFAAHDCLTTPTAGLAGQKNGRLLSMAEDLGFEVFITIDKGLVYQQNLAGRNIAIIVIRTKSNRLVDLLPHADACLSAMRSIRPGEVVHVGG